MTNSNKNVYRSKLTKPSKNWSNWQRIGKNYQKVTFLVYKFIGNKLFHIIYFFISIFLSHIESNYITLPLYLYISFIYSRNITEKVIWHSQVYFLHFLSCWKKKKNYFWGRISKVFLRRNSHLYFLHFCVMRRYALYFVCMSSG